MIAEPLADRWYVVMPELRGHGDSDNSNYYAIWQFIYDLHRVIEALELEKAVVVGHSLGGQIAAHHAAMFPEEVRALVIVEGLGPPERPQRGRCRCAADRATPATARHDGNAGTLATVAERRVRRATLAGEQSAAQRRARALARRSRHRDRRRRQSILEVRPARYADLAVHRPCIESSALAAGAVRNVDRHRRSGARILDRADAERRLGWTLHGRRSRRTAAQLPQRRARAHRQRRTHGAFRCTRNAGGRDRALPATRRRTLAGQGRAR